MKLVVENNNQSVECENVYKLKLMYYPNENI
jgi:hypothetical protein